MACLWYNVNKNFWFVSIRKDMRELERIPRRKRMSLPFSCFLMNTCQNSLKTNRENTKAKRSCPLDGGQLAFAVE